MYYGLHNSGISDLYIQHNLDLTSAMKVTLHTWTRLSCAAKSSSHTSCQAWDYSDQKLCHLFTDIDTCKEGLGQVWVCKYLRVYMIMIACCGMT